MKSPIHIEILFMLKLTLLQNYRVIFFDLGLNSKISYLWSIVLLGNIDSSFISSIKVSIDSSTPLEEDLIEEHWILLFASESEQSDNCKKCY